MDVQPTTQPVTVETNPALPSVSVPVAAVPAKPWHQSWTLIFNGILLVVATFLQIYDLLATQNLLSPFVSAVVCHPGLACNPDIVARDIATLTQAYTLINILLRYKTTQPIEK